VYVIDALDYYPWIGNRYVPMLRQRFEDANFGILSLELCEPNIFDIQSKKSFNYFLARLEIGF